MHKDSNVVRHLTCLPANQYQIRRKPLQQRNLLKCALNQIPQGLRHQFEEDFENKTGSIVLYQLEAVRVQHSLHFIEG